MYHKQATVSEGLEEKQVRKSVTILHNEYGKH